MRLSQVHVKCEMTKLGHGHAFRPHTGKGSLKLQREPAPRQGPARAEQRLHAYETHNLCLSPLLQRRGFTCIQKLQKLRRLHRSALAGPHLQSMTVVQTVLDWLGGAIWTCSAKFPTGSLPLFDIDDQSPKTQCEHIRVTQRIPSAWSFAGGCFASLITSLLSNGPGVTVARLKHWLS